jgi:hypothetical protein
MHAPVCLRQPVYQLPKTQVPETMTDDTKFNFFRYIFRNLGEFSVNILTSLDAFEVFASYIGVNEGIRRKRPAGQVSKPVSITGSG